MSAFRRALTGVTAAALAAAALATPASAASHTCAYETSTRLLTAKDREYKVWVERSPTNGRTYVCFGAGGDVLGGSIDVGDVPGPPPVVVGGACADGLDVEDPVRLWVAEDVTTGGRTVCVSFTDAKLTIAVTLPDPTLGRVVVEIDRDTTVGERICLANALACPDGSPRYVLL